MLQHVALFFHLVAFAAYVGAGFAQQRLMAMSAATGLAAEVRNAYEQLAARILTRLELPAIFGSMLSGALFLVHDTGYLHQPTWFHPKMLCVVLLAVLSHLEMFNALRLVRARAAGGAEADLAKRKQRHAVFGGIGALLVLVLLVLVAFVRTA